MLQFQTIPSQNLWLVDNQTFFPFSFQVCIQQNNTCLLTSEVYGHLDKPAQLENFLATYKYLEK